MSEKTQYYKLERFNRGSLYSAAADKRRFTTLDYNLQSYVGIIGVGIIKGWTIESVSGLKVRVNYGNGLIDGFFAESPYTVKRRSHMEIPEREIEIIRFDDQPEPYMTTDEANDYIYIVQQYNPSFNPPLPIENAYVKVFNPSETGVRSSEFELQDNSEASIYASFPTGWTPYPKLNDIEYSSFDLNEPQETDYEVYQDYLDALADYNEDLLAYQAYKWQLHNENHFTEVKFELMPSKKSFANKVYLGTVYARSGVITKIDSSKTDNLENLKATIQKRANSIIKAHRHGGDKSYDPPAINLSTSIRDAALNDYNSQSGMSTYDILDKNKTSTELGHYHSYYIDNNGNGITVECFGDTKSHSHVIEKYIVSETPTNSAKSHKHTIPNDQEDYIETWVKENQFNVYANNVLIGNGFSHNIKLDFEDKKLHITGSVGIEYKTYFTDFKFYNGLTGKDEVYSFKKSTFGPYNFFVSMLADFNKKNAFVISSQMSVIPLNVLYFETATGDDILLLKQECEAIGRMLKSPGNDFAIPSALLTEGSSARIRLLKSNSIVDPYKISVEVLGNAEVIGVLRPENIAYVHADKIANGVFELARIPFLSHVGRIKEEFRPNGLPMLSQDGIKYNIVPYFTDIQQGHYHTISVNKESNGNTIDVMIGDDAVIYAETEENDSYFIDHDHTIQNGKVTETTVKGIETWQKDIGNSGASGKHTHNMVPIYSGDSKTVYSIFQDVDGNTFAGTSNGLILIPVDNAYYIYINGQKTIQIGNDLWSLVLNSRSIYEKSNEVPLDLPNEYEVIIGVISENLDTNNKSQALTVHSKTSGQTFDLVITRRTSIDFNEISSLEQKKLFEVEKEDTLVDIIVVDKNGKEISVNSPLLPRLIEEGAVSIDALTKTNISKTPYWSIDGKITKPSAFCTTDSGVEDQTLLISGAINVAKNNNIVESPNMDWILGKFPPSLLPIRKSIFDSSGNVWAITEDGIFIQRKNSVDSKFLRIASPSTSMKINDIVEYDGSKIMLATDRGVFSTQNQGKTWTTLIDSRIGFSDLTIDYTNIKTDNILGHFHTVHFDVYGNGVTGGASSGTNHTHNIEDKAIQESNAHFHSICPVIYAIENKDFIYFSPDCGVSWQKAASITPEGEKGRFFAFNGYLFASTGSGTWRFKNEKWEKAHDKIAFSFAMSGDMSYMIVGIHNGILKTYDGLVFSEVFSWDGCPQYLLHSNGIRQNFGFAFSNREKSVYFDSITTPSKNILAMVDFGRWVADRGSWDEKSPYEIYIDKQLVLDTGRNIDRRASTSKNFKVTPSNGMIDFGASTVISSEIKANDNFIKVQSTNGFYVGDKILIQYSGEYPIPPDIDKISLNPEENEGEAEATNGAITEGEVAEGEVAEGEATTEVSSDEQLLEKYKEVIEGVKASKEEILEYYKKVESINAMYMHATITGIAELTIAIDKHFDSDFDVPSTVEKIPFFDNESSILTNIYDSYLKDIGNLTHEQIENKIGDITTGLPSKLQNAYLSNVLQLTQAVKYAYPSIDDKSKNTKLYDMHYSWDGVTYPNINQFIDTYHSNIYTQSLFSTAFSSKKAKRINDILVGKGMFSSKIFVATDVGLFWGENSQGHENNWWYVGQVPFSVFKIKTINNKMFIATSDGLYSSNDIEAWNKETDGAILFPSYDITFRWDDKNASYIENQKCEFYNETDENNAPYGVVLCENNVFLPSYINNGIRIDTSSYPGLNGNYTITSVSPNKIHVVPSFAETPRTDNSVDMTIATWWSEFNEDENTGNANLYNPIIVAGENAISLSMRPNKLIWQSSEINDVSGDFTVGSLCPLTNGTIIGVSSGIDVDGQTNIIKSSDAGLYWSSYRAFSSKYGTINKASQTKDGHANLTVSYGSEKPTNGDLQYKNITLMYQGKSVFSGKIIWNEDNNIWVYEQNIFDSINEYGLKNISFTINAIKINAINESSKKELFFGTNNGLFSDKNTIVDKKGVSGQILSSGRKGNVLSIDVDGKIASAQMNEIDGKLKLLISTEKGVYADEMVGHKLYLRNTVPPKSFKVQENSSTRNGEISIILDTPYTASWIYNVGKKVTISGQNSRLYVTFRSNVQNDEFKGGTIYFLKQSMGRKLVEKRPIISNSPNYIDIGYSVDWTVPYSETKKTGSIIVEGIDFVMVNKNNELELMVSYSERVTENSLVGFEFSSSQMGYISRVKTPLIISSNTSNKILLKPIEIITKESSSSGQKTDTFNEDEIVPMILKDGDKFNTYGVRFEQVVSFNAKKTSIVQDHYHDVDLVNDTLYGKIQSIQVNVNDKNKIHITLTGAIGFDNPVLAMDEKLLNGEKIFFSNAKNVYRTYECALDAINGNMVSLYPDGDIYNTAGYDDNLISEGWSIYIDSRGYGKTNGIYYVDFGDKPVLLIEDSSINSDTLVLETTFGIQSNDKVKISDGLNNTYVNYVDSVLDSNNIKLKSTVSKSLFVENRPFIQVLRNENPNNHYHLIRKYKVENKRVEDYSAVGLPISHTHEITPQIANVYSIAKNNDKIVVSGSSGTLYNSKDDGLTWVKFVDLNYISEGKEIKSVTTVTSDENGDFIAGTDGGDIFFQRYSDVEVESLTDPYIN